MEYITIPCTSSFPCCINKMGFSSCQVRCKLTIELDILVKHTNPYVICYVKNLRLVSLHVMVLQVPLEGFKALQGISGPQRFQIHKAYGAPERLPSAHTW